MRVTIRLPAGRTPSSDIDKLISVARSANLIPVIIYADDEEEMVIITPAGVYTHVEDSIASVEALKKVRGNVKQ